MQSTVILTIGTALSRAEQAGSDVQILVQGTWIHGRVVGLDGHGLVLDDGRGESAVVRLEHVAAVRIEQHAITEPEPQPVTDAAFPMGPGSSSAPGADGTTVPFPRRAELPELTS